MIEDTTTLDEIFNAVAEEMVDATRAAHEDQWDISMEANFGSLSDDENVKGVTKVLLMGMLDTAVDFAESQGHTCPDGKDPQQMAAFLETAFTLAIGVVDQELQEANEIAASIGRPLTSDEQEEFNNLKAGTEFNKKLFETTVQKAVEFQKPSGPA